MYPYKRVRLTRDCTKDEHQIKWEAAHGKIPKGMLVHHKNDDKRDNDLDNLVLMTRSEHSRLHNLGKDHTHLKKPIKHGTARGYRRGCRCALCREAQRERMATWRKKRSL